MKAVRIHGYGADPAVEDIAITEPNEGEVLVLVRAAALNPLDIQLQAGYLADWFPLSFPYTLERNPIRLNLGDSPEARVLIQAVCRRGGRQTCRKRSLSIFGPGCSQRLPRERHIGKPGLGSG